MDLMVYGKGVGRIPVQSTVQEGKEFLQKFGVLSCLNKQLPFIDVNQGSYIWEAALQKAGN